MSNADGAVGDDTPPLSFHTDESDPQSLPTWHDSLVPEQLGDTAALAFPNAEINVLLNKMTLLSVFRMESLHVSRVFRQWPFLVFKYGDVSPEPKEEKALFDKMFVLK